MRLLSMASPQMYQGQILLKYNLRRYSVKEWTFNWLRKGQSNGQSNGQWFPLKHGISAPAEQV